MARKQDYKVTTRLVHGPEDSKKWDFAHHVTPPLSSSTTYRLDSAERGARGFAEFARHVRDRGEAPIYVYDRLDEPTRSILEGELADLEGGEACLTFASGMAAISATLLALLQSGDAMLAHPTLYGCTHSLLENWLPRYGIGVRRVSMNDLAAVRAAVTERTRVLYIESPVNPTLELVDIAALRNLCDQINEGRPEQRRLLLAIDNTFATPFCQRPLELGADIVLHSLTKNLGGFGTEVGGAVICPRWLEGSLKLYRKDTGGILSSKSAWAILVYGLPTLPVRLKRQIHTARKVAAWLEKQEGVARVVYPGLSSFPWRALAERQMRDFDGDFAPGSMIYFELDPERVDPVEFADEVARSSYSVTLAVSLGHTKTLLELPYCMTHSGYGEPGNGVRLSIGLESPTDIIADLRAALAACLHAPHAVR
jgi:cystathionine beta-lyase/cystathionine gamma-synthase